MPHFGSFARLVTPSTWLGQAELAATTEALRDARAEADELKRLLREAVAGGDAGKQRVQQLEGELVEALAAGRAQEEVSAAQQASQAAQQAAAQAQAQAEAQLAHAR